MLETCGDGATPEDRRSQYRFTGSTLVWAISFVGATFLIKKGLLPPGPASWIVAALPTVAAVFLLFAFGRFLRATDEFQRLIQLRALALGFGGSFFVLSGYQLFQRVGAPVVELGDLIVIMPLLYIVGILLGRRRYS